jgi:zinc protease
MSDGAILTFHKEFSVRLNFCLFPVLLGLACPAFSQTIAPSGVEPKATLSGITEYAFPNGLRVLLFPDPSNPKVTVNMTYLVGSRFEGYGETGMAHLLEHMNFIRSTHDRDIKKELTDHGAQWNGTTDYDRTNYFETVTASDENLQWGLGLEAERMVNMRMEKGLLDTEMTVVRNEFERGENSAQNILAERVSATAYLWHNYGKSVIGSRADIERVPIDRLAAFYRRYYQPDNAVLVIAGQFDASRALASVASTVGAIPRPARKLDAPYTAEPAQDGERLVELRRVGSAPIVMAAWHGPALAHPDSAALEVLAGVMVGGGGRGGGAGTGRLYRALVDGKKALSVRMNVQGLHDPGLITATATLSQDQSLDDVRKTLMDTIVAIATDPPTADEVGRAKIRILQGMATRMANSQQAALGLSETIAAGDWRLYFVNYDQINSVTPADLIRVTKIYFKPSNRTVGVFIPTAAPDRTDVPASPDVDALLKNYKTGLSVTPGEAFDSTPANIEKHLTRATLQNGMKLVMLPKTSRGGTVSATIQLRFGDEKALTGRRTTAEMTGALLMRGTKTKTRQQLQDEMLKLDARVTVAGGAGRATATINTTEANLVPALRLAVEMLRDPAFPDAEFDQVKKQRLAGIQSSRTDPGALAPLALDRAMNPFPRGDIRYVGTIDEQIEDLAKVSLNDVRAFQSMFYGASHGEMAVVGQFKEADVRAAAAELLGTWSVAAKYERIATTYQKTTPINVKIETPDKQNATFEAALAFAMSDTDPDYPAMVLANYLFGGSITGRAPNRIRNQEGLSYGVSSRFAAPAAGNAARFEGAAISNPQNTPKVEASFRDELAKTVANGFTENEVAAAKKSLRDQRTVGRSQDAGLLGLIAVREEFDRTLAWDEQMDAKLDALTVDQVNRAFQRHVSLEQLSIVKAGDFQAAGAYRP